MKKHDLGNLSHHGHWPRKHQQRSNVEDLAETRQARLNFKAYLRERAASAEEGWDEGPRPLTPADKARLVSDFVEWNGGLPLAEATEAQVRTYVNLAAPADLDPDAVETYLTGLLHAEQGAGSTGGEA